MENVIWWLNQQETEFVCENPIDGLPEYILDMIDSRDGRPGRGRLWTPPDVKAAVDPWPDTLLAKWLGKDSGGLVIRKEDVHFIAMYPGTVTDLNLNKLQ
jgi:hypothetical protein